VTHDAATCPLCGSPGVALFARSVVDPVTRESFAIVVCPRCDHGWTSPFVFRADAYDADAYAPWRARWWKEPAYRLARAFNARWKLRFLRRVARRRTGAVLDVGSGCGAFAAFMRDRGWRVAATEPSAEARTRAAADYGLQLAPDLDALEGERFDGVTLWHVIEHVLDPCGLLDRVRGLLAPDGVMVAAFPNRRGVDASAYGADWAALDPPRHLHHFTARSAESLFAKAGLVVLERAAMPLDPFYAVLESERRAADGRHLFRGARRAGATWLRQLRSPTEGSSLVYGLRPVVRGD
jgi:SAM-dependent methyltransferase